MPNGRCASCSYNVIRLTPQPRGRYYQADQPPEPPEPPEKISSPDTQYDSEFWRDVDYEGDGGHGRY
jgi:hypothetical protein